MRTAPVGLGLLALGAILAGCANAAKQRARDREPLLRPPDRTLAQQLIDAEYVVAGTLIKVKDANVYESVGGGLLQLFGFGSEEPEAYQGKLLVDSTLIRGQPRTLRFMFFAPKGNRIPMAGTTAIWVLHRRVTWRRAECYGYRSGPNCPYDLLLALDSDDDVQPLGEWPRVRDILRTLRLIR